MTERLITERELRELLRELRILKQRVAAIEVVERLNYTPPTSYTPTYLGGTTPGTTTYSFQDGSYIQLGKLLIVRGQVAWTASTGTGNAQISLPVAASGGNFTGSLYVNGVTFAAGTPEMLLSSGNSFFTMGSPATNAGPTTVQMEAAGNVIWTVTYFIA